MGRSPEPRGRDADAPGAGVANPSRPMGARRRRLRGAPVRRAAASHDRGAERSGAGHAGLHPPPLRPGAPQPRRSPVRRLHEGHSRPAGRDHRARQGRRADGGAHREPERVDPLQDARARPQAARRAPGELDAALHARAQPARGHERLRRRRRLPELPRRLCGHPGSPEARRADGQDRVQPLHAEPGQGEGGLRALGRREQALPGRRIPPAQRRG